MINIVFPVFIIIGVGFSFSKLKKISLSSINDLVIYITTPCLIISSLSKFPINLELASTIFLTTCGVVFICLIVGGLIVKSLDLSYQVHLPPILFANTGNMGLPLLLFAFGQVGFNIGILYMVSTTFLHYTLGIVLLNWRIKSLEIFKLPLIYSTIIGIIISIKQYQIPVTLDRSIELLGDITIPAMIFSLGYKLAELKLSKVWLSFLIGSLRIFIGFFAGLILANLFNLDGIAKKVVILEASMPPAVFNFVLAEKYRQNSQTVASIIMAGTIVSFFVIPLIISYLIN
ncbi:MAG: hypothetical protein GTO02_05060 [Candidatus Dadabacteria bacterium]|nr:hypothetical protein [Candidatus Dadabacteria bacterium]NIQ13780.1 hypothetical protein [Candidatus Dadabacteria bacterium]